MFLKEKDIKKGERAQMITKLRYTIIILFIALIFTLPALAAPEYVASRIREPFHRLSCRWANEILPSNAVYYETRDEAANDGHRPCKICNP